MNWIYKRFIKNHDDINNPSVRLSYGKLSGKIGIFCNVLLFISKFIIGTFSRSVSITADAINNLSDAASSIISLVGFKMAERPADEDHPYGHARYEYLSGLAVSIIILIIGVELFKISIDKILNPRDVEFNLVIAITLVISILIKVWLAAFNRNLGLKINSETIKATSTDSRNDVITTTVVLIASTISRYTDLELDGYMGIAVAMFILYSGIGIIKSTVDPLIGKAPDPEFVKHVQEKIMSYPGVLGTHDLIVHDYGPARRFASVHVEMSAEANVLDCHDVIDNIERDFKENDNLNLIIHFDPIITSDDSITDLRNWLCDKIKEIDKSLSIHDLRIVPGKTHTSLIFDCVMPVSMELSPTELKEKIKVIVSNEIPDYYCVITIDRSFAPIID